MHLADRDNAREQIGFAVGIGLVQHAFVAFTRGAGFVCIDPGNNEQLVPDFFVHVLQTADIFCHAVFAVCRTGADDEDEFVAASLEDIPQFLIPRSFLRGQRGRKRIEFLEDIRRGQLLVNGE